MSENPTETSAEDRTETPAETPAEDLTTATAETPAEASTEISAEAPAEGRVETSAEDRAETPVEAVAETPVVASGEGVREAAAQGPGEAEEPLASAGESAGETGAPPGKRLRRGRVAAVSGAVLLVAAVIGGVGWTASTVDAADRAPGKPTWRLPKAAKDKDKSGKEKAATGLAGMLLPYDDAYTRGPDLGEFGADARLNGRQATALRKESLRDMPRTQRRRLEKEIDEEHIKGVVMRSYASADAYAVYKKQAFTARVTLSQMENQRTVRNISRAQNELLASLGIFRKGPKIDGHKNAGCFLPPKNSAEKLDMMFCSAYEGDVLVTATVSGIKPLDGPTVTRFLTAQLDRITDPGEAV
ncbi:hypothetical protein [Streptomyces aureus]|uniref:hypothetical protein n=1 Tax=Streptomyces aureus TaxID=193461 RepID=UPI0033D46963